MKIKCYNIVTDNFGDLQPYRLRSCDEKREQEEQLETPASRINKERKRLKKKEREEKCRKKLKNGCSKR